MPEPTGVIFDMDGILVLTEEPHWQSWLAVAVPRGVTLDYDTFLSCFGRVNDDCFPILFGDVDREEMDRVAEEKEQAFRDIIREDVPLAPGTRELLAELKAAGVKLAVGSSGPRENVDLVLDSGRIREYFGAVVTGNDVTNGKPAPDAFLLAANRLNVPVDRCAVVEDAPPGIEAARAAGMLAVGVTTTHTADQLRGAGANHLFKHLADLASGTLLGLIEQQER